MDIALFNPQLPGKEPAVVFVHMLEVQERTLGSNQVFHTVRGTEKIAPFE